MSHINKSKLYKIIIIILLYLFSGSFIFPQIYFLQNDSIFIKESDINKIFKKYVKPEIPKELIKRSNEEDIVGDIDRFTINYEVYFFVFIKTTAGKITAGFPVVNRLYGIGNHFVMNDSIWIDCEINLRTAIKEWVFKPVFIENNSPVYFFLISFRSTATEGEVNDIRWLRITE